MSAAPDFDSRTLKIQEATRFWADAIEEFLEGGGTFSLVDEISTSKGRGIKLSVEEVRGSGVVNLALVEPPEPE